MSALLRLSSLLAIGAAVAVGGCALNRLPVPDSIDREHPMLMLLAYAIVHAHWQGGDTAPSDYRGYNIGSVLVDPNGIPVHAAVNANTCSVDGTQHGEVRLLRDFLSSSAARYADGYSVYTTLEPCVMCTGLMTMAKVSFVVHGQLDPEFGGAHDRLNVGVSRSANIPDSAGPEWRRAYPRLFSMKGSSTSIRQSLEMAYREAKLADSSLFVGTWLHSQQAERLFAEAHRQFCNYSLTSPYERAVRTAADSLRVRGCLGVPPTEPVGLCSTSANP
ncbi:MAG: nucleoside deaminase [Sinimarinibacterium flocculans]|uniref:nucleoside deaminase n=2 Tax=Sinimarinibacterium flocculans TaxID=985250 RepID=UPI003C5FEECC